jgi:hypothetical protein
MHGPINVESPNNINKWQMGFNSAFKGLNTTSLVARVERQLEDLESLVVDKLLFAARIFLSSSKGQERECTYKGTLRRVRATIVVVEKQ